MANIADSHFNTFRLRNQKPIVLEPNVITEINIELPENMPNNSVYKLQHHCTPWRVIHRYIYTNNKTVTVPILTSSRIELEENQILATLLIMPTFHAFASILQGNETNFYLTLEYLKLG